MSRAVRNINKTRLRSSALRSRRILVGAGVVVALVIIGLGVHGAGESHVQVPVSGKATQQLGSSATKLAPVPVSNGQSESELNKIISSWAAQNSFNASVVVKEIAGGSKTTSYNATASMVPASTYKIFVAYAILHGIEKGNYSLDSITNDGNSIQTDLNNMILNSDNDAARTLGFLYGWQNINALLKTIGITNTDLYNYVPPSTQPVGDKHTTAQDLATTLDGLYTGKLLNSAHTQLLLGLMKAQRYRERIPAGVPNGVVVADKPGWLSPADGVNEYVQNDAAIVYGTKSTYILVITTTGGSVTPLANLSMQIYAYLES